MGKAKYGIADELQDATDREVEPSASQYPAICACFEQVVTEIHNS